jgi:hypothetical protein
MFLFNIMDKKLFKLYFDVIRRDEIDSSFLDLLVIKNIYFFFTKSFKNKIKIYIKTKGKSFGTLQRLPTETRDEQRMVAKSLKKQ